MFALSHLLHFKKKNKENWLHAESSYSWLTVRFCWSSLCMGQNLSVWSLCVLLMPSHIFSRHLFSTTDQRHANRVNCQLLTALTYECEDECCSSLCPAQWPAAGEPWKESCIQPAEWWPTWSMIFRVWLAGRVCVNKPIALTKFLIIFLDCKTPEGLFGKAAP